MVLQSTIQLSPKSRGIHIITSEVIQQLPDLPDAGLLHLFVQHTSAGIGINENADPDVRHDFEKYLDKYIPEGEPYFKHLDEGLDDMPSHIKSAFVGHQITIPITSGKLNFGTWQGIYLFEFRNHANVRRLIATIIY